MRPSKEELEPYGQDIKAAAKAFNVTEQTVRRWLKHYGLYHPRRNFGPKHIPKKLVNEIRMLAETDKYTQKELGERFGLSQAMIGRIINNDAHHHDLHFGVRSQAKVEQVHHHYPDD